MVGPRVRDGAITWNVLDSAEQLPWGIGQQQAPGHYRLQATTEHVRAFAWANGPQGIKPWLFRAEEPLWQVRRDAAGGLTFQAVEPQPGSLVLFGVRPCDLAALALQDAHFIHGPAVDEAYRARRERLWLVAVNCSHPADTCFCASTGDGPACVPDSEAAALADIILDELDDGFVLVPVSERARQLCAELSLPAASTEQREQVDKQRGQASSVQRRTLPADTRGRLAGRLHDGHWQQVAERCLACGNCTSVCPTCFCHRHEELPELDGSGSTHQRVWDSCFSAQHSYIHGVTIRGETAHRYRQWLTHKLMSWYDQYGRSGCVGCGRCISWCPVGIDITAEAHALLEGNDE